MAECPKCHKQLRDTRWNCLVSELCEECYEKEVHFTPDMGYPMKKRTKERTFDDNQIVKQNGEDDTSLVERLEQQLINEIKEEAHNEGYSYAMIFDEFDLDQHKRTICDGQSLTIAFSYFFTNDKFEIISDYDDRKKYKRAILC